MGAENSHRPTRGGSGPVGGRPLRDVALDLAFGLLLRFQGNGRCLACGAPLPWASIWHRWVGAACSQPCWTAYVTALKATHERRTA